jgi:hypothetical protein
MRQVRTLMVALFCALGAGAADLDTIIACVSANLDRIHTYSSDAYIMECG